MTCSVPSSFPYYYFSSHTRAPRLRIAQLGDPHGVEGGGAGLYTSVTASRMTDA